MMKTMRILSSLALCACMLLSVCALGDEYQYTGSAPVAAENTTITWVATNSGSLDFDWSTKLRLHELCERANVTLDIELIDSSVYKDTILPRLAAGVDLPDVIQIPVDDANMAYANSGLFYDMAALYEQYAYNMQAVFDAIPMLKGQLTTPDGKMFFFPTIVPGNFVQQGLLVTMPYLERLNAAMPTTVDELYDLLVLIRDSDVNGDGDTTDEVPLFIRAGKLQQLSGLWGIDLVSGYTADKDGKLFYSYTSEEYRDFLAFFKKLYEEKLMNADFVSANYDIQSNLYANDRIGVMVQFIGGIPISMSREFNPDWDQANDDFIVEPIMPLGGKTDEPFYIGRDSYGERFAINANSEVAKEAFCFMDYVMSTEAILTRNWGDNYTLDDNGMVNITDVAFESEHASEYGANFKGIPDNEGWVQVANGRAYNEIMPKIATATKSPTIVFSYLQADEIKTSDMYKTDLKTYVDEMCTAFITGTRALDEWDDYVATCQSLHADDLLQVNQAIYDRLY